MRFRRHTIHLSCVLVVAALLVGCTPPPQTGSQAGGVQPSATSAPASGANTEARVALSVKGNENFDPVLETSDRKTLLSLIYDPLIGTNQDLQLTKDRVVEDWTVNPDSTQFTYKLRRGIKFEDGTELTAKDVKFSMERISGEGVVSTNSNFLKQTYERIETPDDYTVVIYTKGPKPTLTHTHSLRDYAVDGSAIVPKHIVEQRGKEFALKPMGSGPYRLTEFAVRDRAVFEAWTDNHWAWGPISVKRIIALDIPDPAARIAALRAGNADIIALPLENKREVEAAGFNLHRKPGAFVLTMHLHEQFRSENPLSNPKVRRAMSLAIDRQKIISTIYDGEGRSTACHGNVGYTVGCNPDFPMPGYDVAKAKQQLADAGYPSGFDLKFYSVVRSPVDSPTLDQALASMFGEIGIRVQLIPQDYSAFRDAWSKKQLGNAVSMINHEQIFDMETLYSLTHQSNGLLTMEGDSALDELLGNVSKATMLEARQQAMRVLQQHMYDQDKELVIGEVNALYASDPKKVAQWDPGKLPNDVNFQSLRLR